MTYEMRSVRETMARIFYICNRRLINNSFIVLYNTDDTVFVCSTINYALVILLLSSMMISLHITCHHKSIVNAPPLYRK